MVLGIFTSRAAGKESRRVGRYAGELEGKYGQLQTGLAQDSLSDLGRLSGLAIDATQSYGNQARGALDQGYTDARRDTFQYGQAADNAARTGAQAAMGQLSNYGQQSLSALDQGLTRALSDLGSIEGLYQPYAQAGAAAQGLYADSLGINGADGNARATGAFQAGPGYQWQVDQATDAAARKASALGVAGSGNTLTEIATISSNLANQEYGNWQNQLSGLGAQGLAATGAVGANRTNMANVNMSAGRDRAGMLSELGSGLAGLESGYGQTAAGIYSGIGSGLSGLASNWGTNTANTLTNVGSNVADIYGRQGAYQAVIRGDLGKSLTNLGMQTAGMVNGASEQAAAAKGAMGDAITGLPFVGLRNLSASRVR